MTETSDTKKDFKALQAEIYNDIDVELKRKILVACGISRDRAEHATYEVGDGGGFWSCVESVGPLQNHLDLWRDIAPRAYDKLAKHFGFKTRAEERQAAAESLTGPSVLKKKVAMLDRVNKQFDAIIAYSDGGVSASEKSEAIKPLLKIIDDIKTSDDLITAQQQIEPLLDFAAKACVEAHSARTRAAAPLVTSSIDTYHQMLCAERSLNTDAMRLAAYYEGGTAANDIQNSLPSSEQFGPPQFATVVERKNNATNTTTLEYMPTHSTSGNSSSLQSSQPILRSSGSDTPVIHANPLRESEVDYWRRNKNEYLAAADRILDDELNGGNLSVLGSGRSLDVLYDSSLQGPSYDPNDDFRNTRPIFTPVTERCCEEHMAKSGYRSQDPLDRQVYQRNDLPLNAIIVPVSSMSSSVGMANQSCNNSVSLAEARRRRYGTASVSFGELMRQHRLEYALRCDKCSKTLPAERDFCAHELLHSDRILCTACARDVYHECRPGTCWIGMISPHRLVRYFAYREDMHYMFIHNAGAFEDVILKITQPPPSERLQNLASTTEYFIKRDSIGVFKVKDDTLIEFRHRSGMNASYWGSRRSNHAGGFYRVAPIEEFVHFTPFADLSIVEWLVARKHFTTYQPTEVGNLSEQARQSNNNLLQSQTPVAPLLPYERRRASINDMFRASGSQSTNNNNNHNSSTDDIIGRLRADRNYLDEESKFLSECAAKRDQRAVDVVRRNPSMSMAQLARSHIPENSNDNYSEFLNYDPYRLAGTFRDPIRKRSLGQPPVTRASSAIPAAISENRIVATPANTVKKDTAGAVVAAVAENIDRDDECTICLDAEAIMKNSNCSHTIMCSSCAVAYIEKSADSRKDVTCTICRAPIVDLLLDTKRITTRSTKRAKAKE